jgi:hypothetical protein
MLLHPCLIQCLRTVNDLKLVAVVKFRTKNGLPLARVGNRGADAILRPPIMP